jgi:hypothetical protein
MPPQITTWRLIALRTNGSAKQASAWLKWLEIRTRETLQTQWLIVVAFADELLRIDTLNGEQVNKCMAEFLRTRAVKA